MPHVPYDASRRSLYHPGAADDFFQLGPISGDGALCAEMARLAYVGDTARLIQYLARARFQLVEAIGYDRSGAQAFIATSDANAQTVVAFRGTEIEDPRDAFADVDFTLVDWSDSTGLSLGQVHAGFARFAGDEGLFQRINAHLETDARDHRVLITGHSLGAALATLLASWAPAAHLHAFGSPRVGTADFALSIRNPVAIRYVDCCDVVTRLPPRAILDYAHAGTLSYIDRKGAYRGAPEPCRDAVGSCVGPIGLLALRIASRPCSLSRFRRPRADQLCVWRHGPAPARVVLTEHWSRRDFSAAIANHLTSMQM